MRLKLIVVSIDDRNTNVTELVMRSVNGHTHKLYTVKVDPTELFVNALENAGIDKEVGLEDFLHRVDRALD